MNNLQQEKDKRYRTDFFMVPHDYLLQEQIQQNPDIAINTANKYNYINNTTNITGFRPTRNNIEVYKTYQYKCSSTMTPFMKLFFSKENMINIQNELKYEIYLKSGSRFIINPQDPQELGIIMESMYYQYSSRPIEICLFKQEISRMNKIVLNYCIQNVLTAIEMQNGYLKKITDDITGIDIGEYTSKKGLKITKTYTPKI